MGNANIPAEGASNSAPPTRLPDYFPRAPAACLEPATVFFACFTEKAEKIDTNDTDAGLRGLQACATELKAYEKCMNALIEKQKLQPKQYRVCVMKS